MPENNLMYSVIDGYDLPETDGFRYHSDIANQPVDTPISTVNLEMESWLENWKSSTQ